MVRMYGIWCVELVVFIEDESVIERRSAFSDSIFDQYYQQVNDAVARYRVRVVKGIDVACQFASDQ